VEWDVELGGVVVVVVVVDGAFVEFCGLDGGWEFGGVTELYWRCQ